MFSPIATDRLELRRLTQDDVDAVLAYRSHPDVVRFQNWEPRTREEVAAFIAEQEAIACETPGDWFQLGIIRQATGGLVGDVGIRVAADDRRQAEVGITIAPEHQGRGYATEALQAVFAYLFVDRGKHRVFASIDPRNHASLALVKRAGMRKEAHFIESLWFKGEWADDVIYALLAREWR